jgi:hypothetical protein
LKTTFNRLDYFAPNYRTIGEEEIGKGFGRK